MQGSLIKFHILFHCLLDGGQFTLSTGISLLRSVALRSCTNSRRAHLDGKFSASLCQKTLKYI